MIKMYDGIKFYGYVRDGEKEYYKSNIYGIYLHVYKYQLETGLELMDNQVVHHIDGDKHNNDMDNLVHMFRWCHRRLHTYKRYISAETKIRMGESNNKKVQCVETGVIYNSILQAKEKTGILHISEVCTGKRKTAGGFMWKFI